MSEGTGKIAEGKPSGARTTWPWLPFAVLIALLLATLYPSFALAQSASTVSAVRIAQQREHTRITLESPGALQHNVFTVVDPDRLVIDLEGVEPGAALDGLGTRIATDDPTLRSVRVGRFRPGVTRVVFDLRQPVRVETTRLQPAGESAHRLVLDLHPLRPVDDLMALVESRAVRTPGQAAETPRAEPVPVSVRTMPDAARPAAPVAAPSGPAAVVEGAPRPPAETGSPRASMDPLPVRPGRDASPPEQRPQGGRERARLVTVVIDPGHGGEDPGAIGRLGTHEKDITLSISRRLKALIDDEPGMRAVLTREGDYFVPLHARVERARRAQGDLFVSIHADAFIKPHARGSSVFALSESGATSAAARWLAKRENDADLIGGVKLDVPDPYLRQTLLDLSQTATINDSLKLGRAVLGAIGGVNTLHKNHVEQAGFAVLKAPDIPSILVETAFISNPEEEKRLRDEAYQGRMAAAILAGIKRYFAANPPLARSPQVALTEPAADTPISTRPRQLRR